MLIFASCTMQITNWPFYILFYFISFYLFSLIKIFLSILFSILSPVLIVCLYVCLPAIVTSKFPQHGINKCLSLKSQTFTSQTCIRKATSFVEDPTHLSHWFFSPFHLAEGTVAYGQSLPDYKTASSPRPHDPSTLRDWPDHLCCPVVCCPTSVFCICLMYYCTSCK